MIRRRTTPDGLPFRLYERHGVRLYSIGYKAIDGTWQFRLKCRVHDKARIAELRRDAIRKSLEISRGLSADSFAVLVDAWFERQERLPVGSPQKRAASTLAENRREAENLKKSFGTMRVQDIEKADAYAYLDACLVAVDPKTLEPRPRPEKGNKEISLAKTILEFAVRMGKLQTNPFRDVERLSTSKTHRYVTDSELALALQVGRRMGGAQHIVALALKTAYLCVRRSVEVRALTRPQITDQGITWLAAKRQRGESEKHGLIEWSDELRATIDEALPVKRRKVAGTWYVFGNLRGQRYTKGGWKASLVRLMDACQQEADAKGVTFRKFSLQDCRPKAVSDKLARGDADVIDATMHSSERMVRQVYDRRRVRIAKPAR